MDSVEGLKLGRRRRTHSDAFKAKVIEECRHPGMSIAAVALANGLNANLLRRWVIESPQGMVPSEAPSAVPAFIPVAMADPSPREGEILIEVQRGATQIKIRWPASSAGDCGAWLRGWLR